MSVQIQRTEEPGSHLLTAQHDSFVSEVRAFVAAFDRPTVIFWSTQIFCWMLVVVIAMLWGLGG